MTDIATREPGYMLRLLMYIFPNWIKRTVLIASFIARYSKLQCDDDQVLTRLNDLLSLTRDKDGMKLPMLVNTLVWQEDHQISSMLESMTEHADQPTAKSYATQLVGLLPSCFKYGTVDEMVADFTRLFTAWPQLSHH